jgi:hypothetical protein
MLKKYVCSVLIVVCSLLFMNAINIVSSNSILSINRLFLIGITALLVGCSTFVVRSGFLDLFFIGFSKIRDVMIRQSRSMQAENERLKANTGLNHWKISFYRNVMIFSLGLGTGLVLVSIVWAK